MKKKRLAAFALVGFIMIANATSVFAATFGSIGDSAAKGTWSDTNNLTWTWWDGSGSVVIGAGPKFGDAHPEIIDPEYFLKENICYPGENVGARNSQGLPKANYTEGTLPLLQEFVNSFDWIHSDEVTRLKKVHDRLANGKNGNTIERGGALVSFQVLQDKKGNCGNYAWEFAKLCNYVGLECVSYSDGGDVTSHMSCLVNINGQWITVDPYAGTGLFDNGITVPVDFEIERYRYENEVRNSAEFKKVMSEAELQRKAESGEITWTEYFQAVYPDKTVAEIEAILGMDMGSYAKLWE